MKSQDIHLLEITKLDKTGNLLCV